MAHTQINIAANDVNGCLMPGVYGTYLVHRTTAALIENIIFCSWGNVTVKVVLM